MDGGNEQRVAIKFCFKAGLSATGTLVLVQKSYDMYLACHCKFRKTYTIFTPCVQRHKVAFNLSSQYHCLAGLFKY